MTQYSEDTYSISHYSNRSPGSIRGPHMMYRPPSLQSLQQSLHFDTYRSGPALQSQGLFTSEDHATAARFETTPRYDRMGAVTLQSNYPFENPTWGCSTLGGSALMNGTTRSKSSARRPGLPNVSL